MTDQPKPDLPPIVINVAPDPETLRRALSRDEIREKLTQAEQALRTEQAEASLQVTRLTSERDEARARIDALGDESRLLATDLAQERRAAETYRQQRDAARNDAEQASRLHARALMIEQPATFREWLRTEIRRDPAWWREILRREVRLGWMRDDFRRAHISAD